MSKLRELAIMIARNPNYAKSIYRIASFVQAKKRGKQRNRCEKLVPVERAVSVKLQIREQSAKEAQAPPLPRRFWSVANGNSASPAKEVA